MATPRTQLFRPKGTGSHLPSLIIPCPRCGGRMMATSVTPLVLVAEAAELEDIAHGCKQCGTELIRTVMAEQHA